MKMKLQFMRKSAALLPLGFLLGGAPLALSAQEGVVIPTAKILVIEREYTKPGKDGASHEKSESAFIHAAAAAKAPMRYIAATSLSGPSRALFMSSYPTFAAWEEERKAIGKDAALSAALDRAGVADGDLLSEIDTSVWVRRDDLSLNAGWRTGARYESFSLFTIRPGHQSQWDELVKLVIDAYKKGVPEAHWGAYQEAYGTPGSQFLIASTIKSGEEIDGIFDSNDRFLAALGESGLKKLEELESACVESRVTNLFAISPKMSYPPEALVTAEPDFWKPAE
jgi:hypothetical protein